MTLYFRNFDEELYSSLQLLHLYALSQDTYFIERLLDYYTLKDLSSRQKYLLISKIFLSKHYSTNQRKREVKLALTKSCFLPGLRNTRHALRLLKLCQDSRAKNSQILWHAPQQTLCCKLSSNQSYSSSGKHLHLLQSFYSVQGRRHSGASKRSVSALPPFCLYYWDIEQLPKYIRERQFLNAVQ